MTVPVSNKGRELWPDLVKIIACILVVCGHFSQSMVKSGFMDDDHFYRWFQLTIYSFQVPLFFICSGYLYQKYSKVNSFDSWLKNVFNKAVSLGVPYVVFTLITLLMKTVAGGLTNSTEGGFVQTLFFWPTAPYWFLYTLFTIFLLVPTANSPLSIYICLIFSFVLKLLNVFGGGLTMLPYALSSLSGNLLWFTLGMCLAFYGRLDLFSIRSSIVGLLFLPLSVLLYVFSLGPAVQFIVGIFACVFVISICVGISREHVEDRGTFLLAHWTMPVFLMHTIFAAGFRIFLLKGGITQVFVHVSLGFVIGFIGPVLAMTLMEHFPPLDFLVFPNRYIKFEGTK